MEISSKIIYRTCVLPVAPNEAFNRWTTEKGLTSFFAPNAKVELEIGGAFELYFMSDAPKGLQGSEGCKILSFIPGKMLSFSWNAPPQFKTIRNQDHKTWVVLLFNETAEGNTELELTHYGWPESDEWNQVYAYFENAWTTVLSWLVDSFNKKL